MLVPGLNAPLEDKDYEEGRLLHNSLSDDTKLTDDSQRLIEHHLPRLFNLVDQFDLLLVVGFHSAHRHFTLPAGIVQFGTDGKCPVYRRTEPTPFEDLRKREVHGHHYAVTNTGLFKPYAFQEGKAPDFSRDNMSKFLQRFIPYMMENNLQSLIAFVLLSSVDRPVTYECFEGKVSVMVDGTEAENMGYERGRTTGWVGSRKQDGQVASTGVEYHHTYKGERHCWRDTAI